MNDIKYIGMDVHKATIVIAVLNGDGKLIMESIIETKAATILGFIDGLRGTVHVTFEEGTLSHWLYHLIKGRVARVIVCDPRNNKLLGAGNKGDRVDARKLAELLRAGLLRPVYHEEHGMEKLKELVRSYQSLVGDSTRIMNRIKAVFRGRGIACTGREVYRADRRDQWLEKLSEPGRQQRAGQLYEQLDFLRGQRQQAKQAMISESRQQKASRLLRTISGLGPVRVALLLAVVGSPHRFRTKRPLWKYIGLAVITRTSAEYEVINGRIQKSKKAVATRGLNNNYNHTLKEVFKSAATHGQRHEPWKRYYEALIAQGMPAELARVTLARKIAAVTLSVWKKGERFDAEKLRKPKA